MHVRIQAVVDRPGNSPLNVLLITPQHGEDRSYFPYDLRPEATYAPICVAHAVVETTSRTCSRVGRNVVHTDPDSVSALELASPSFVPAIARRDDISPRIVEAEFEATRCLQILLKDVTPLCPV